MPSYRASEGSSRGIVSGSYGFRTLTEATTIGQDDDVLLCDADGGAFTVSLPPPRFMLHKRIEVKLVSASGSVTIEPTSGLIDGASGVLLVVQYESVSIVTDGTNWHLI